jgi:epoxyqueuosine reductase
LVFLFDYKNVSPNLISKDSQKIARYTLGFEGLDYHLVLKKELGDLGKKLASEYPDLKFVLSLDIHPVLERDLAYRAGLGWFGKNSMMISKNQGSYFIIGSLLFNQSFNISPKSLESDHCGTCTACLDACPTDAIDGQNRTVIADKCISTFTIELFKDAEAPIGLDKSGKWIFGCDICQEVCPWNKKMEVKENISVELSPMQKELKNFFLDRPLKEIAAELEGMSNSAFQKKFKETPMSRTGRVGLLKNLKQYF